MARNLVICLGFALILASCGNSKNDGATQPTLQGVAIPGSQWHGLAFTAVNVQRDFLDSRLYYYEFETGMVRQLASGESGHALVFWADGRLLHFNSRKESKSYRAFDPRTEGAQIPEATPLPDLAPGDPWDVMPLVNGSKVLLASASGGALQILDHQTGELTSATNATFAVGEAFRPMGLHRQGAKAFVVHRGTNASQSEADGTQQLFTLGLDLNGGIKPQDEDPATALIDGVPLTAANPMGFIRPVGERPLVVGLCAPSTEACTAGADRLDPATGAVTKLAALDDIGYVFWNQIVAGSDGATVYAHVKSAAQDSYHVIKLNVETGTVITALHQFPDERRYGIASDPSSRSLFIGGQDEFKGHISVYRDDVLQDTFALDGVPYHFALVPKP